MKYKQSNSNEMKKVSKKLELNKSVVANLNSVWGGEATKTWNCGSKQCASNNCPTPTVTLGCVSETPKAENGCWNTDFTCTPSNGETCGPTDTYVTCP